jgi:hypothetical protein
MIGKGGFLFSLEAMTRRKQPIQRQHCVFEAVARLSEWEGDVQARNPVE